MQLKVHSCLQQILVKFLTFLKKLIFNFVVVIKSKSKFHRCSPTRGTYIHVRINKNTEQRVYVRHTTIVGGHSLLKYEDTQKERDN